MKNILIFNEEVEERRRLSELLRTEDFNIFETSRVLEAVHILKTEDIKIVLVGQNLDGVEGPEFRELVEKTRPGVGILFTGAYGTKGIAVSPSEFKKFIHDSITTETELKAGINGLKEFFFSFADRLLQILEVNDRYFFNNDHLVAEMSRKIAQRMGLEEDMVDAIKIAALLRDIGKVGIQHQLLEEKKRLDQQELIPIKNHPLYTVQILKQIKFPWDVDSIIAQHHEHYDGSGYPMGIKGRQIVIGARIISVADSYYAMTSDRPYRNAIPKDEAIQEMLKKTGSQFDPEVVEVFQAIIKEELTGAGAAMSFLILERQPTVSALIRLSVDSTRTDIIHAANTFDALRYARQKAPNLIMADVEMLDKDAFLNFFNVIQEIPAISDRPFIFIIPDKDYPKHFKGKRVQYIVKPLNITELTAKITGMLAEEPAPALPKEEPRGLSGTLEDFSITDIVQILNLGLKTAKVDLTHNGQKGTLYLYHGRIVHATAGGLTGNDAFFEMIGWKTGTFHILHGLTTTKENITMNTMHLLLEASRVLDEKG